MCIHMLLLIFQVGQTNAVFSLKGKKSPYRYLSSSVVYNNKLLRFSLKHFA